MMNLTRFTLAFLILFAFFSYSFQSHCLNSCSNHGTCSSATCTCNSGWTGIDCSVAVSNLPFNTPVQGRLDDHNWKYYVVNVTTTLETLKIELHQTATGDCDLYVRKNNYPNRALYDQADVTRDASFEIDISTPSLSSYYIGVYGFYHCQYELLVEAITKQSCPNSCSGHGICVNGNCSCNMGYTSVDCSQAIQALTNGSSYTVSIDDEEWSWFSYNSQPINGKLPSFTFSVIQTTSGDSDIYVALGRLPGIWDYDIRDISYRANYSVSIGTPEQGIYYAGVYGYDAVSFRLNFTVASASSCASQCSMHGTCNSGSCSCNRNFIGTDCETMSTALPFDTIQVGYAPSNTWNYYHFSSQSADNAVINFIEGVNNDCDLYVRAGSNPTRFTFDYRDISYNHNFSLTIENPQGQTWYIGVYGYLSCNYSMNITSQKSACPNNCSGAGTCNHEGRCNCDGGWAGDDCSSPLARLYNGVVSQGSVRISQWSFFKYQVPDSKSSLTVACAEQSVVTPGSTWLYVKQGAPPTLIDYDYKDENTTIYHTIYFPTQGAAADTNFYVGVYGSPFGQANRTSNFGLIAYSPPF